MFGINLRHTLATVAFAAGLLAAAGSASAGTPQSGVVVYNGHAGLGAAAYQHHQTDLEYVVTASWRPRAASAWLGSGDALGAVVTDGTSNTVMT